MPMLLMCHLLVGLLIGLLVFQFLRERRVVLWAMIGSILPDLIDKPLGHIVLNSSIDYGRIYAHSGLFMLSVLFVGIAYHHRKSSWIILGLAMGIISHSILDSMWQLPVTLFYPFFGDFGMHNFPNYLEGSIMKELESAYEWMFGISALASLLYVFREKLGRCEGFIRRNAPLIVRSTSSLLIVTGILSISLAVSARFNPLSGEQGTEANLIIGLVASIGGSLSLWMWKDRYPGMDDRAGSGSTMR